MFPASKDKTRLDLEIDQLVLSLKSHEKTSDEYGTVVDRLAKLSKIREESRPDRISYATLATIATNLIGIAMITRYERENVLTSKALGFIMRPR